MGVDSAAITGAARISVIRGITVRGITDRTVLTTGIMAIMAMVTVRTALMDTTVRMASTPATGASPAVLVAIMSRDTNTATGIKRRGSAATHRPAAAGIASACTTG